MNTKVGAARLSIFSNTLLVGMKLVVGIMSGSIALISEAVHSATDLAAAGMVYFSVRAADAPADEEHPFGHGKIENLSGTIEAGIIFAAAAYIIYESLHRLIVGGEVRELNLAIGVMFISGFVNIIVSRRLFRVAKETDSVALEADARNLSIDVYTAFGVLVGLLLIKFTGLHVIDPIIGLFVAAVIAKVAYDLVKKAGGPLIDVGLPQAELSRLIEILCSDKRVLAFHKLRTRKAGAERHIDVHLLVSPELSVGDGHSLAEKIEDKIRDEFTPVHVITHVEPMSEEEINESTVFCEVEREDTPPPSNPH